MTCLRFSAHWAAKIEATSNVIVGADRSAQSLQAKLFCKHQMGFLPKRGIAERVNLSEANY